MLRITTLRAIGAMLLTVGTTSGTAQSLVSPAGSCDHPITISAKDDAALRDAFNRGKGSVRLVFLIDPICPTCLRGLKDLDTDVLSPHASDKTLQTLVINTPVLGATEKDTANTCSIVHNGHVTQYWDPNQELGTLFANALGMKFDDKVIYAWDVWLIYGPNAEWTGAIPPKADFLMHQLPDLMGRDGFPFLRAPVFAAEVEKQLKSLEHAPSAGKSKP
ncbi:MAG TPA: hypothetical protein VLT92_11330 [Burkholderiales bacterium]|nr:hypothetical protein [Burkholderiales bacterium]